MIARCLDIVSKDSLDHGIDRSEAIKSRRQVAPECVPAFPLHPATRERVCHRVTIQRVDIACLAFRVREHKTRRREHAVPASVCPTYELPEKDGIEKVVAPG